MRKIVFATNNLHKLEEMRNIAKGKLQILSLSDICCHDDIEETGDTLEENGLIKARFVKDKYGYDCFADDTGLEVEALGNAPGVYSARYAGAQCSPEENMVKMLANMQGETNRKARFRTVVALIYEGREYLLDGEIKGRITEEKRGAGGFGYDPIFLPDGYSQTFAELGEEVKNKISHRALAMVKLVAFFDSARQ